MTGILRQSEAENKQAEYSQKAVSTHKTSLLTVIASLHVEKPRRVIPKMAYASIFLLFAVPAMAMFTYGRVTERLESPQLPMNREKQPWRSRGVIHRQQAQCRYLTQPVVALSSTKQSLSMLSDAVDWSQVAACVKNTTNCICYGYQAQRLNIVPDTCDAAISYGRIVPKKL